MSQIERIFYINRRIQEDGVVTTKQIMQTFELSRRQVLRDIDYLRDTLEAPLVYEKAKSGYTYSSAYTMFSNSNERLLVLNAMFKSLAQTQGGDFSVLTDMVQEGLDSGVEEGYRSLSDKIVFISPLQDWPDYTVFNKVCSAMKSGERMTMHYHNARGEKSVRHIEPLRLVNYTGRWYLLSYDLQHKELRTFHLSRIESIHQIPGDRIKKRYADEELSSFIHDGYGIFLGSKVQMVSFSVYGWAMNTISTQTWHPDQKLEKVMEGANEALKVTIPVANMQEILSRLLSFGAAARPISPPEFVQLWKRAIQELVESSEKF